MFRNKSRFFTLFFIIATIISCKTKLENEPESSNLTQYADYISCVPKSQMGISDLITFCFTQNLEQISQERLEKSFAIDPKISGTLTVQNQNNLVFTPDKYLKSDQKYIVKIDLDQLYNSSTNTEPFEYVVKTISQDFSYENIQLVSSVHNPNQFDLTGTVQFADLVQEEDLEKLLRVKFQNKTLSPTWRLGQGGNAYEFTVANLTKGDQSSELNLKWNHQAIGSPPQRDYSIEIPGKHTFEILHVDSSPNANSQFIVNFSEPLLPNQDLNGLITLEPYQEALEYTIEGNLLKIFVPSELRGDYSLLINDAIRNYEEKRLNASYRKDVYISGSNPEIRFAKNGNILPSADQTFLNFEAKALRAVDIRIIKIYQQNVLQFLQQRDWDSEYDLNNVGRPVAFKTLVFHNPPQHHWKAYGIDLSSMFEQEKGAIYHVDIRFKKEYANYTCDGNNDLTPISESLMVYNTSSSDAFWNEGFYYDDYYQNNDEYNWQERNDPCSPSYYKYDRQIRTNILSSNLGLIVKKSKNEDFKIFVTDLISTLPVSGAEVKIYNFQKVLISQGNTNEEGLINFTNQNQAHFIVVEKDSEYNYMYLRDGNVLSTSQFAVSGAESQEGLKGFIYGDRGIWRPGDSLFLNFVLNDRDNPLPEQHPVTFELYNPENKLMDRQVSVAHQDRIYHFPTKTPSEAKTGNWLAKVKVGGAEFYRRLPIETIRPNRLKIDMQTNEQKDQINLQGKWLHGASIGAFKATIDSRLWHKTSQFPNYEQFHFDNPLIEFEAFEKRIFEGELDANGQKQIPLDFKDLNSPGLLQSTYTTKIFEPGGSFSIDTYTETIYPYESYAGLRLPNVENGYPRYDTDDNQTFEIVALNKLGKPVANQEMEIKIYKIEWRWWWSNSNENLASYVGNSSHKAIFEKTISTNAQGKSNFEFGINYPEWGRYLILVKNKASGHVTGQTVYFDWPSWRGRTNRKDAEAASIIAISTDKDDYTVEEHMEVSFPSSENGRALITIESGSSVLESFWIDTKADFTKVEIPITSKMAPNVYIGVHYLQKYETTKNDLPLRMYGYKDVNVNYEGSKLKPIVKAPSSIEPQTQFAIQVSENQGKSMSYTLAIVDEGLLGLTRFETPNIWRSFYAKQALGVKTWDVYDRVIGAFGGRIDQVFSVGGGGENIQVGAQKANRFPPVVKFLGSFQLQKNETKTHQVTLPNYVGNVRVMLVASNSQEYAYGHAEANIEVKKPLMLLANLPRKLSPGEELSIPITIFNSEKSIKSVRLSCEDSEYFEVNSPPTILQFASQGEQTAYLNLKVGQIEGIAKFRIKAESGSFNASQEIEMDIVNPNQTFTVVTNHVLASEEDKNVSIDFINAQEIEELRLEVSTLPNVSFTKHLDYLIEYPYGCLEQMVSKAFPQLYLEDIISLSDVKSQEVKRHIETTIQRLSSFQNHQGGFSYWPGQAAVHDWVSSYVGHFLLEAQNKGYLIPEQILNAWKVYQKKSARDWRPDSYRSNDLMQSYRLFTLALAGDPDLSSMNRLSELNDLSNNAKWRLALAYSLSGNQNMAANLIVEKELNFPSNAMNYTFASDMRNHALALETAIAMNDQAVIEKISTYLGDQLSQNAYYSTQSRAFALIALGKLLEKNESPGIDVLLNTPSFNEQLSTDKNLIVRELDPNPSEPNFSLKNNKQGKLYINILQRGKPKMDEVKAFNKNLSLKVNYLGLDGKLMGITKLSQTTDFIVEIQVSNMTDISKENIALTYILPSGWEVINTRYVDADLVPSQVEYTDIRDDRIHYFFNLMKKGDTKGTVKMRLQINAAYPGTFYLAPTYVEAMYDGNYQANTSSQWIEVEKFGSE